MKTLTRSLLIATAVITSLALVTFAGCGDGGGEEMAEKQQIDMVYVNWAEGVAMTHLCELVLEEKMGYDVTIQVADVAPVYQSLASGDKDVFMDSWLPITHQDYLERFGDQMDDLGNNYEGAKIGLVVPTYVTINSIAELNDAADRFDGQIIGIDSGAGIMRTTNNAIEEYNLTNMTLVPSSGPAMTASLKDAVDNEEWAVVTGWKPHWKFARWDLKFLQDPKTVFGESENIHCITRKGFAQDVPEAATFFRNFMMNDQQLGSLMGAVADAETEKEGVRAWLSEPENMALVESWIPSE